MAKPEVVLAVVALVVSLVALLVTTMQLLASLFATAGGRHRCTETVIGPWGKFTKIKRHWLEARFEVFFLSPEIRLAGQEQLQAKSLIDIKAGLLEGCWSVDDNRLQGLFDMVSYNTEGWGAFLAHISHVTRLGPYGTVSETMYSRPAIVARMRSWDALPIDVSRPIARTTLHDIAVLANRMGLIWEHFEPEHGKLLAQDGPLVLSSLEIRGLGLALSYRQVPSFIKGARSPTYQSEYQAQQNTNNMIRDERVDKFLFGIVPTNSMFCPSCHRRKGGSYQKRSETCQHDVIVRTSEDRIKLWLSSFGLSAYDPLSQFSQKPPDDWLFMYATNDIIHMCAPMLIRSNSVSVEVFPLCSWYTDSALSKSAGRSTFVRCLRSYIAEPNHASPQLSKIMSVADQITGKRPWDNDKKLAEISRIAQHAWRDNTDFLSNLDSRNGFGFCYDLLRAHMSLAPKLCAEAEEQWRTGKYIRDRDLNVGKTEWRSEQIHLLFDNIPQYVNFMEDAGWNCVREVPEAWITLLFRGICWGICHVAAEAGTPLPTKYYGSMMPLYLV